ncbi:glycoside hydrolase family 27 protein [Actinoplanes subtropicus]|uniref:glycoside hydrolase family 27 protein n=1 Tax=Actinoplanes subtropicus TaxID=543632 RepID=UPI0004C46A91|nr:ricin-type beta-trefoil lectin domain protein [Actinoplanes subtropicus]
MHRRRGWAAALAGVTLVLATAGGAVLGTAATRALADAPEPAWDNGLAATPPMGWNSWYTNKCAVTESSVKSAADTLVSSGMAALGYKYVNIDDCWMQSTRDSSGNLQPDYGKFPDGIAGTADYIHGLGLKIGIYESAGTQTCQGLPGSYGHEQADANLFASWRIDLLKYDNCGNHGVPALTRYTAMRDALHNTGRAILYSICNWGQESVPTWGAGVGNMWRTTGDSTATYASMLSTFKGNMAQASFAGPHGWNDPDLLQVGNGKTATEDQAEFSLWAEMAAPLIASTDLASASSATMSALTNSRIVAVDQDSLGVQGTPVKLNSGLDALTKPLSNGDVSVVLFNETDSAATVTTSAAAVGKSGASSYRLTNLWTGATTTTTGTISASVPAHGVVMYRVSGGTAASTGWSSTLLGAQSSRCLDATGAERTNGTQVELYTCVDGAVNQYWHLTPGGEILVYGNMCLDAKGATTTNGTPIDLYTCVGSDNERWVYRDDGHIVGVQSGKCLDAIGQGTANGTKIDLYTCVDQPNEVWNKP